VTKYLRKQFKRREDLFWLTFSEVSVYGQLAPLCYGDGKDHGRTGVEEQSCSTQDSWYADRERERERDQGPKIPFKDTSPVIYFHQPGLTS
jgi:hypothetical protein